MIKVIPFIYDDYDDLFANTYVLVDSFNNAVVIDPSKDNDNLGNYIEKNSLNLKGILLTHAHFDHMRGLDRLVERFHVPFYVSFEEVETLTDPKKNCSYGFGKNPVVIKSSPTIVTGDKLEGLLEETIHVLYTPYHTKGSISFFLKESGLLFSGDSLFKGSVGRSDLPTSSRKDLPNTMQIFKSLPDETKVYPGHGGFTSVAMEKAINSFLNI